MNEFLPIEIIFNLLCVMRRKHPQSAGTLRSATQRRGLIYGSLEDAPRLSFWVHLCQAASLLDEMAPPYPTLLAGDWLSFSLADQLMHLLRSWMKAPLAEDLRRLRERLPGRLLAGAPLGVKEQFEVAGMEALGLCEGAQLTPLGQALLTGELAELPPAYHQPWLIEGEMLYTPYPPDWGLLYALEAYIDPLEPGVYPLSFDVLRQVVQRGALLPAKHPNLPAILEAGLGTPSPRELLLALGVQPVIEVLPGPVLAFKSAEELLRLRERRSWRNELGDLLSSRHVHIDPWRAPVLLRRLHRLGLLAEADLEAPAVLAAAPETLGAFNENPQGKRGPYFSTTDRAYILALLLFAEGLQATFGPPPGLYAKLVSNMDESLRISAARKANEAMAHIVPPAKWIPEEEPPEMPEAELIDYLEKAIRIQQPIDVMYQAAERSHPEYRHITPYLLEQRGLRWYLIGYCHIRRANRTFRLDRMKLLEYPPFP